MSITTPTYQEFFYIGFSERQVNMLRNQPDDLRHEVYNEGIRLLMETGPGYYGETQTVVI